MGMRNETLPEDQEDQILLTIHKLENIFFMENTCLMKDDHGHKWFLE